MYKVINRFQEKNHNGHIYEKGDVYPAEGKKLVKSRADFLTKPHQDYGVAFLEEEAPTESKNETAKSTEKKNGSAVHEKSDE